MSHIISRHDMIAVIGRRFQALGTIHSGLLFDLTREESAMRDGIEAEDIHRFRVEIKKLRAFLRLIKPGQRHVLPAHLRDYYRSLGAIRNLQLQELRLRDAATIDIRRLPVYADLLRSQLSIALRQASGLASDVLLPHAQSRALDDLPAELGTETVRDFLWKASTGIQALLTPDATLTDRNLHELRKILKDLTYNHKYLAHESAHILPPALTAGKEKVEPLLVLLGRFQDYCSGLELLRSAGDSHEQRLLAATAREWEREKGNIRHQFRVTYIPIFQRLFASGQQRP